VARKCRIELAVLAFWLGIVSIMLCSNASGDVGGQIPGPGPCAYPGIGNFGVVGEGVNAQYYVWCDEPTEINGSHRHCELAGAITEFNAGVSFMMFNAGIGGPIGFLGGSCSYRCPNNAQAQEIMPNPPSVWLSESKGFNGVPCASVGDPLPLPFEPGGIAGPPRQVPPYGEAGGAVRVIP
jgi:hypothetical protein